MKSSLELGDKLDVKFLTETQSVYVSLIPITNSSFYFTLENLGDGNTVFPWWAGVIIGIFGLFGLICFVIIFSTCISFFTYYMYGG